MRKLFNMAIALVIGFSGINMATAAPSSNSTVHNYKIVIQNNSTKDFTAEGKWYSIGLLKSDSFTVKAGKTGVKPGVVDATLGVNKIALLTDNCQDFHFYYHNDGNKATSVLKVVVSNENISCQIVVEK